MGIIIRDASPTDTPFLAECILAGFHFTDFDDLSDSLQVVNSVAFPSISRS